VGGSTLAPENPGAVFLVKAFCAAVIFIALFFFTFVVGPQLETRYYPVVGYLQITKIEPMDDGRQSRIWVQFEKLRESCAPIEVHWYRGNRAEVFERVNFYVEKPIGGNKYFNRPAGMQRSGPWVVAIPSDEIRSNAFSDAEHRCWPFWTTRSHFYPPPPKAVTTPLPAGMLQP
jgi:hypothetical protein